MWSRELGGMPSEALLALETGAGVDAAADDGTDVERGPKEPSNASAAEDGAVDLKRAADGMATTSGMTDLLSLHIDCRARSGLVRGVRQREENDELEEVVES